MKQKRRSRKLRIKRHYSIRNDVTLRTGNCLKLLKEIPDSSAKLIITSPPYNLSKVYEKKHKKRLTEYINFQKSVIAECVRILRMGGSICWQVGNHIDGAGQILPLDALFFPLFAEHQAKQHLRLRNRIVWHFEHGLHCQKRFSGRYETMLWYTKGDRYSFNLNAVRVPQKYPGKRSYRGPNKGKFSGNPRGKNPGDLWAIPNVKGNHVEKTSHPCQFPIELPMRMIKAVTKPGDLVVDPFLGVGSTAAAAVLLGRRVAGSDLISSYIRTARQRVKRAAAGQLRYRPSGTPVYTPRPNTPLTTPPPHFRHKG